ncbi:MAG: hypothetical protein AB7H97_16435 [Pseudobdellovibrionaceae bacterium]
MELQQVEILIGLGNTEEAKALLQTIQPQTLVEHRMKSHLQGKVLFNQGAYTESIRIYEETIRTYGLHVSILGDLASSFYVTGDFKAFDRMLRTLENEFAKVHARLSRTNLIQTAESMRRMYRGLEIVKRNFNI